MAFRFRLEALLSMRERHQELAEAKLARILGRLRDCREAMEIIRKKQAEARQRVAEGVEQGMLASEYAAESQHIMALEARIEEFRKEETKLRMKASKARHDLKVAHRERELVEKLRERDFNQWKQEIQRHEQNEADDLSTIRYIRERNP